ncbi:MAG: AMP-binding protein, partial [Deltaproteobacteria bacterium]|nr:AMP-binding protein [Deltaproteobacteria bacterium]
MGDREDRNSRPQPAPTLTYPDITLAQMLDDTAREHPDYIATTLYDSDLTYGEIAKKVNETAHALAGLGVGKGDRVALILPNSPTYMIAFFGIIRLGAVAVNVNVMTRGAELVRLLNDADAGIVVTLDLFVQNVIEIRGQTPVRTVILHSVFGLEKKLESGATGGILIFNDLISSQPSTPYAPQASPDDTAVLQYTSGSSGAPKTTVLTHRNFVSNIIQLDAVMPKDTPVNAGVICIVPFFHIFGLTIGLLISVFKAYRMILLPQFDWSSILSLFELIQKYRPFSFPAVS